MKIKIKKLSQEVVYSKIAHDYVFVIGDKQVRVSEYQTNDQQFEVYEGDYEVNETDLKVLTDDEKEAFEENLSELYEIKVGETFNVEI